MGNNHTSKNKRCSSTERTPRFVNFNCDTLTAKLYPIEKDYFFTNKAVGNGMNGNVLLIERKSDHKRFALKRLEDNRKSRREITLQWRAGLECDNIVKIVDVYENKIRNKKYFFVVMEYMQGGELFHLLKKRTDKKKKFTELEVAKIMNQICTAVNHLHRMGIAHRDLKPENLLMENETENSLIKLCDFGFAKEAHEGLSTPNFTPYYVPPEILRFEKYDISCDIWSLGVIMYILCCGYPPFYSIRGKTMSPGMRGRIKRGEYDFPPTEWLHVSQDAKNLISGMLETVPEKRLTIDKIMSSKWMLNYLNAPKIELNSISILNQDSNKWSEYQMNMGEALSEMRVNYDRSIKLKQMKSIQNNLYQRRLAKMNNVDNSANKNLLIKADTERNGIQYPSIKRSLSDSCIRSAPQNDNNDLILSKSVNLASIKHFNKSKVLYVEFI